MSHWKLISHMHTETGFAYGVLEGLLCQTDGHVKNVIISALESLDNLETQRKELMDKLQEDESSTRHAAT